MKNTAICFLFGLAIAALIRLSSLSQSVPPVTQPVIQPVTQPATQLVTPVFNGSGKPIPGSRPVNFIYDQNLFPAGADRSKTPDPVYVAGQIKALPGNTLTIIDHEVGFLTLTQWNPQVTSAQVRACINQYAQIIQMVRKLRPDLKPLTFFGCCNSDDYDYWQCENTDARRMLADIPNTQSLKQLASLCDVITVPVYDTQASGWQPHTYRQLMLGRVWGKKVYAVLCPAPNGNLLDPGRFAADAQWAAAYSDGLVVWDWDAANAHTAWVQPFINALSK